MSQNKSISALIALDGSNGGGKSSVIKDLAKHLNSQGYDVVCTAEPGGTPIGEKIRVLARSPENSEMSPLAGMLLFAAARAQNVAQVIKPALERNCICLVDRWQPSSRAFQSAGQGLPLSLVSEIGSIAIDGVEADYNVIFDLDPRIGLERTGSRKACDDKFELTGLEFLDRVRADYLAQAEEDPERFDVIDASRTYEQVLASVIEAVDRFLGLRSLK